MKRWILINIALLLSLSIAAQIDKSKFIGLYYGITLYKTPSNSTGVIGYNQTIKVTNNLGQDSLNLYYSSLSKTFIHELTQDSILNSWAYPDHGGRFYSGGDSLYYTTFSPSGMGMYTWEFWGHRTATGIEDLKVEEATMFPNPAENELNVILPWSENGKYRILSSTGQLMMKGNFNRSLNLNTQDIPAGVYIFEYTSEQNTFSKKFLKTY